MKDGLIVAEGVQPGQRVGFAVMLYDALNDIVLLPAQRPVRATRGVVEPCHLLTKMLCTAFLDPIFSYRTADSTIDVW